MGSDEQSPLVSTEWLSEHLNDPNVQVMDVLGALSRYENDRGISFNDREGYLTYPAPSLRG